MTSFQGVKTKFRVPWTRNPVGGENGRKVQSMFQEVGGKERVTISEGSKVLESGSRVTRTHTHIYISPLSPRFSNQTIDFSKPVSHQFPS